MQFSDHVLKKDTDSSSLSCWICFPKAGIRSWCWSADLKYTDKSNILGNERVGWVPNWMNPWSCLTAVDHLLWESSKSASLLETLCFQVPLFQQNSPTSTYKNKQKSYKKFQSLLRLINKSIKVCTSISKSRQYLPIFLESIWKWRL